MKFLQLDIQGFKSFGKKQTFVFPDEAGLYFLTGVNEVEPELEGNAAGKTTTWDAVCWCLYGKTPRNAKAGDIKNWYSDEKVVVSLQFQLKEFFYTITRTWSPNSIELRQHGNVKSNERAQGHTKLVTQEDIVDLIKLDFDHFLYSVLFSQFRAQFFDLKQAEKTELFTQILNLEEWDGYSKRAGQQVSHLQGLEHDIQMDVAHMKGNKDALASINFDEKIEEWDKKQKELIREVNVELKKAEADLIEIKQLSLDLIAQQEKLEKAGGKDITKLQVLKDQVKEALKEEKTIAEEILEAKTSLRVLKEQSSKFGNLGTKCPTCEQSVDPEHIEREVKKIKRKIKKFESELADLNEVDEELIEIKSDIKSDMDSVSERINSRYVALSKVETQLSLLKREVSKVMMAVNQKKLKIETLKEEQNPIVLEKQKNADKISTLSKEIISKSAESLRIAGQIEQTVYWVKAFKNIRLFLISEVLTQLELEVNNCLFRLGMRDWRIEFDIDKENKSGTVRKGFTILIYSPYNTEPVVWESWSGGETQRLKLAGTVGLSNLILARCGVDSYIEAWDEPTQFLSAKGVDQLLETLDYRAQELNKQIWLIDHRSLEFGSFAGMYEVRKSETGSYFSTL